VVAASICRILVLPDICVALRADGRRRTSRSAILFIFSRAPFIHAGLSC
jgi:hypothetical protein